MSPLGETATPEGVTKPPGTSPGIPNFNTKTPLLSNFCTRVLPASATYTLPAASVAIPLGVRNCPSVDPEVPHFEMKLMVASTATAAASRTTDHWK